MTELMIVIDKWRKDELHIPQYKFAAMTDMSETYYSQLKRGQVPLGWIPIRKFARTAKEHEASHILAAIGAAVLGLNLDQISVTLD